MISRILSTTVRVCVTLAALAACVACGQAKDNGEPTSNPGSGGSSNTGANTKPKPNGGAESSGEESATGGKGSSTKAIPKGGSGGNDGSSSTTGAKQNVGGTTAKGSNTAKGATGGSSSKSDGAGGSSNATDVEPTLIGDVEFSKPSQSFKEQIQIGMTTKVDGAEIRYTADGSVPSASSTLFSGEELKLTATTQLRAQAFVGGTASGAMSTAIYIARTIDAKSDIPIMIVDNYNKGQPCDKEVDVDAAVMIWEPVDGVASMDTLPTVASRAGMHVRGQSSVTFAQTPYKLELWDNNNKDLDYPIMGMPADSDWALVPPYYDRSLLRNPFTFALGKDMGMEVPRNEFAEVYINLAGGPISDTQYRGIYWVTETIKNNKVRTNLKSLKESDTDAAKISGGYIFKFDQMAAEEPKLTCTGSNPLAGMTFGGGGGADWSNMTTPSETSGCEMKMGSFTLPSGTAGTCWLDLEVVDPDPLNAEQKTWLTNYVQKLHDSLIASPIGDYESYIDIETFISYFIISELTLNVDAYTKSAYYFKDRDQKLKAGPLWDYNFALGGVGAPNATPKSTSDTGWRYNGNRDINGWYPALMKDPNFVAKVKERYTALRKTVLSPASIEERINTLSKPLKNAVARDYAKWPVSSIILSTTGFYGGPTAPTWEEQVKVLHDFVLARLTWMDENLK